MIVADSVLLLEYVVGHVVVGVDNDPVTQLEFTIRSSLT